MSGVGSIRCPECGHYTPFTTGKFPEKCEKCGKPLLGAK